MEIPCVGFGTYNEKGGDNYQMILAALNCGYRYFDTASLYETERDLGKAIKDSDISRKELFMYVRRTVYFMKKMPEFLHIFSGIFYIFLKNFSSSVFMRKIFLYFIYSAEDIFYRFGLVNRL